MTDPNQQAAERYVSDLTQQRDLHFDGRALATAVAYSLCEESDEGSNKSVLDVGGYPIRSLCDFLLSLNNPAFSTYKFAEALRDHEDQQLLRSALSEIEIIGDDYITIVCFGTPQPSLLMKVNQENQLTQFGRITIEEIDTLRKQLASADWNDRKDRKQMPCNIAGTLHRISRIGGGFIIRLGSLRDRKKEVTVVQSVDLTSFTSSTSSSSTTTSSVPSWSSSSSSSSALSSSSFSHNAATTSGQSVQRYTDLFDYQLLRDKIEKILKILSLSESVLLVSAPGKGKTSLLRELLRGIAKYVKLNEKKDERVILVDKNHEIVGTGKFGRDLAYPCRVSYFAGSGENSKGMMHAMEASTCTWVVVDEINEEFSMIAANKMSDRGVTMLATAHVCLGGTTEDELVNAIMGSPHSRLLGSQKCTTIGDKLAKEQNTNKDVWGSKTKPPFKWIVHLRGLAPNTWSEPVHVKPALQRYFENKNRRDSVGQGGGSGNGGGGRRQGGGGHGGGGHGGGGHGGGGGNGGQGGGHGGGGGRKNKKRKKNNSNNNANNSNPNNPNYTGGKN